MPIVSGEYYPVNTPVSATMMTDHNGALKTVRQQIESRLYQMTPPADSWPARLHAAQRHALLSPGKRFRPLLCVFIAKGCGFEGLASIDVGCTSEMVHAASLILDDLPCMDNADLRRNQPTTHIAFDESTAILSATALLNRAFGVIARLDNVSADQRIDLVDLLSYAVGSKGLIAGQMADISNTSHNASITEIEHLNALKTGALFDYTIEAAAVLAQAPSGQRAALRGFSRQLGLAFQLLDDLKDSLMNDEQAEKSTGRDIGKATILALTSSSEAKTRLNAYLEAARNALSQADLSNFTVLETILTTQFSAFSD